VKTDLDGSNRQTVIFGTGKEDDQNTILLASRDWKYLALLSRRDSSQSKLYIIDTSNDKLTLMDDSDAVFTLAGWSDHDFAYSIQRNNVKEGEANRQAVKKYNADKTQLLTVDQSAAEKISPTTMATQFFSSFYLVDKELTYVVTWQTYVDSYPPAALTDHPSILQVVLMSDGSKKDIKIPDDNVPLITHLYAPSELYIATYSKTANKNVYYEYEDGKVSAANNLDDNKFYGEAYSTYLASPDGTKTFWSEQRDGKDTFFVGDAEGKNGKQIGVWDEYQVYGWYGNSYLLVSKGGSELFIVPVSGGDPLKISDYHKPVVSYQGYGGGYGGL
jgi:hypothetical protein